MAEPSENLTNINVAQVKSFDSHKLGPQEVSKSGPPKISEIGASAHSLGSMEDEEEEEDLEMNLSSS